jgi:dipeptidyl-peptidase-4
MKSSKLTFIFLLTLFLHNTELFAQGIPWCWSPDGIGFHEYEDGKLIQYDPVKETEKVILDISGVIPSDKPELLSPDEISWSSDKTKLLMFVNTVRVWRKNTKGDYWIYDLKQKKLIQIGKQLPAQSLMFAKFSPDGQSIAYVSVCNLYVENISTNAIRKLTLDGTRKKINGTFDWAYEEEFGCRDGFRWSPDGKAIAFWQIDATKIRDYFMLNTIDSVYSRVIPVEYPKAGEEPSSARIGVISLSNGFIRWMNIDGDPRQHYLTRMEWSAPNELIIQQLDRKQQESKLIYANTLNGETRTFWAERDEAWVDLNTDNPVDWHWINQGQDFLWISEKDGWRHIYRISRDGKKTTLLTRGNYDIGKIIALDEANQYVYFTASPYRVGQLYLGRVKWNLSAPKSSTENNLELVTDTSFSGYHDYNIAPNAKFAKHSFSNHNTPRTQEWVTLPNHIPVNASKSIAKLMKKDEEMNVQYVQVETIDKVVLDAWIRLPDNFNPSWKYPVVVYVYGEPGGSTIEDQYGKHENFLYTGKLSEARYIQIAIDSRGTPSLKGAPWRKSIYRRNGQVNIRDMAMGIKELLKLPYMDTNRVAVWGWSGGGSSTLHLMFQFPEIFQTGIAVAPVTDLRYYDNIYTERYMGLPQENMDAYIKGSAITHASGLTGNLLLIHGTGDDNVHYSNTEALINELVKHGKQFHLMSYPNRTHGMSGGVGTFEHLIRLYSDFLDKYCPPGVK